jgi:hypothetical protein
VKQSLANIKSVLRKKAGKRGRRKNQEQATQEAATATQLRSRLDARRMNALEERIDEVLHLAKATDREGLVNVIRHLRAARNLVVMEAGWE